MRTTYIFLLGTVLSFHSGIAQDDSSSTMAPPVLAFVYDGNLAAIRPIWGTVGAAILGMNLHLSFPVATASVAPQQDFALTVSADDQQVRLVRLRTGEALTPISGALVGPDRMILSPAGSAALLYRQSAAQLQIVTGLPDKPVVASLALPPAIKQNPVTNLAVSDDGEFALLAASDENGKSVWLIGPGNDADRLLTPDASGAVAFRRYSHDAIAALRTGDLLLVRNPGDSADYRQIQGAGDSTSNPLAVQISPDGNHVYVAGAKGTLAALDLETGAWNSVSCQCTPAGLYPLKSETMFRLTDPSDIPVLLFDVSGAQPRIWFVPADSTSQGSGQ
jgi:WD40 repeat protein